MKAPRSRYRVVRWAVRFQRHGEYLMRDWPLAAVAERQRQPELMDQPGLDMAEHARALDGLRRINRVSRSAAIYWPELRRLAETQAGRPLRVLDLASGGGDVPISLALRAMRAGLAMHFEACDKSSDAMRFASDRAAARGVAIHFFRLDVLADEVPAGFDVIISSLFFHHLDGCEAVRLLQKMACAAGELILINDLLRGPIEYAMAWAGCRLLSRSPIVRHDGPVSVSAAFTMPEVRELARQAALDGIQLTRHWPGRFLLSWRRP
jgi:SAM-dependent methyltransferase